MVLSNKKSACDRLPNDYSTPIGTVNTRRYITLSVNNHKMAQQEPQNRLSLASLPHLLVQYNTLSCALFALPYYDLAGFQNIFGNPHLSTHIRYKKDATPWHANPECGYLFVPEGWTQQTLQRAAYATLLS